MPQLGAGKERFFMKRTMTAIALVAIAAGFLLTACDPLGNVGDIKYLTEEVYVYEEQVPDVPSESRVEPRGRGNRKQVDDFEYEILRVAQVLPVEVGSSSVQANDIVFSGSNAYVVYNTAGDVFAGALQVIDFSNPRYPVITTEIGLPHADVNAVAVTNEDVYIGGAWDPDFITGYDAGDPDRAFIAKIALADLGTVTADEIDAGKVILDSFVATGIAVDGNDVFVSTGALDGELEILDTDLVQTGFAAYSDLRDIEIFRGGVVALQGTQDSGLLEGRVLTVDDNGSEKDELVIEDFGSPEKKATIEVYGNKYAFLGLSEAGFQIVYLKSDSEPGDPVQSVYTIENPTGLDWTDKTDTNSASYNEDLIVTANGEAGFRIFRVVDDLDKEDKVENFTEAVGFVPFDETDPDGDGVYWSANHVEYRTVSDTAGFLAVASGTGGVNLYYLTQK